MKQDWLDEYIAKRAERNPDFPRMVEGEIAEQRRARPSRPTVPTVTVQRRSAGKHRVIVIRIQARRTAGIVPEARASTLRSLVRHIRERVLI